MPIDQMDEIEKESGAGALAKSLGLWQLTAIGVGGIIGVGIFSLAGLVAHGDADNPGVGPALLVAFLIAGLASAAAAWASSTSTPGTTTRSCRSDSVQCSRARPPCSSPSSVTTP